MKTFYLGSDQPCWLKRTDLPLFYNRRCLNRFKKWPKARGCYAIDSGGYTELAMYGKYTTTARQYVREVHTWSACIGKPDFVSAQDWMCDPESITQTRLSVKEHQHRTIYSYLELNSIDPKVPWMPVVQGYTVKEYIDHIGQYRQAGVNLATLPCVAVGSVTKEHCPKDIDMVVKVLHTIGCRVHGFGFKKKHLCVSHKSLYTADSSMWSKAYQFNNKGESTLEFASAWRQRMINSMEKAS